MAKSFHFSFDFSSSHLKTSNRDDVACCAPPLRFVPARGPLFNSTEEDPYIVMGRVPKLPDPPDCSDHLLGYSAESAIHTSDAIGIQTKQDFYTFFAKFNYFSFSARAPL